LARRKPGEGTISATSTGRVFCEVTIPGTGKRRRVYVKPGESAVDVLDRLRREVKRGVTASHRLTVGKLLEEWLVEVVDRKGRPNTQRNYHWAAEQHLIPALGRMRLADMRVRDAQGAFDRMLDRKELSLETVYFVRGVLSTALHWAMRMEMAERNVAALVLLPPRPRRERAGIPSESLGSYLAAIRGDRLEPLYLFLLGTGLRSAEARAILWEDVDWEGCTVRIERQIARVEGLWQFVPLKTDGSKRVQPISPFVVEALRRQRILQAEARLAAVDWADYGLVFTGRGGKPLNGGSVLDHLYRLEDAAGLPRVWLHKLRHTYANALLDAGVSLKVVSESLGHTDIATTSAVYTESSERARRSAANALQEHWREAFATTPI
jgi:integrase